MKKKPDSPGKQVMHRARAVARQAKKRVTRRQILTPPPSELRLTPQFSLLVELKQEAEHLQGEIGRLQVLAQDHPASGNHMADDASEVFEQTKNLALKRHLERKREQVELAIHRIEKGNYGICDTCGKAIGPERLQALPYATTCVNCAKLAPHPG